MHRGVYEISKLSTRLRSSPLTDSSRIGRPEALTGETSRPVPIAVTGESTL